MHYKSCAGWKGGPFARLGRACRHRPQADIDGAAACCPTHRRSCFPIAVSPRLRFAWEGARRGCERPTRPAGAGSLRPGALFGSTPNR